MHSLSEETKDIRMKGREGILMIDFCVSERGRQSPKTYFASTAAMRIAPVALFCYDAPDQEIVHIAKDSSLLTHANRLGYNGAVLQVILQWSFFVNA